VSVDVAELEDLVPGEIEVELLAADAGGAVESEVTKPDLCWRADPVERPDVQEILPGKAQVAQNVSLTQLVHLDEPADLGAPLLDPDIVLPRFVPGLELPDGSSGRTGLISW